MFVKSSKNTAIGICVVLAIAMLIALMTYAFISDAKKEEGQKYLADHVSTTGVVIEKYTNTSVRGTTFYIIAEHTYIAQDGSEAVHSQEYRIMNMEDWQAIQLGDTITATVRYIPTRGVVFELPDNSLWG